MLITSKDNSDAAVKVGAVATGITTITTAAAQASAPTATSAASTTMLIGGAAATGATFSVLPLALGVFCIVSVAYQIKELSVINNSLNEGPEDHNLLEELLGMNSMDSIL